MSTDSFLFYNSEFFEVVTYAILNTCHDKRLDESF